MSRVAIIGAGPIGLEAALLARQLGHDVNVFEKGRVAENILDWGHVRLFSPFGMNSSEWGRGALAKIFGSDVLPREDELLTSREFAERYLIPLSQLPELSERIHEQCQVLSLSRHNMCKTDSIGSTARGREPFQLLMQQHHTNERIEWGDVVLDCSGTYPHHNWIGNGGSPCVGERHMMSETDYRVPSIRQEDFGNRTTLVIGSGFSAATSVVALAELAQHAPRTKVLWLASSQPLQAEFAGPIARVPNDSLVARDQLAAKANELASIGRVARASLPEVTNHPVIWFANVGIKSLTASSSTRDVHGVDVELDWSRVVGQGSDHANRSQRISVDRIIANVGYRPDRSIYEELHVHECYATQGPIKLATKLLGETSSDCLALASHGCDVLKNPEPNFFILGSKSYGRNSNFLLRTGIEQVREVVGSLPNASRE